MQREKIRLPGRENEWVSESERAPMQGPRSTLQLGHNFHQTEKKKKDARQPNSAFFHLSV